MEKQKILDQIKGGLIVSCQALEHEPLYTKEGGIMPLMAKAAAQSGAVGIRANTVRDITQIKEVVALPVIGIIKKDYEGTPMYITVTMKEVDALVACGVDIVAVQGTGARRPDGSRGYPQLSGIGHERKIHLRYLCEQPSDHLYPFIPGLRRLCTDCRIQLRIESVYRCILSV